MSLVSLNHRISLSKIFAPNAIREVANNKLSSEINETFRILSNSKKVNSYKEAYNFAYEELLDSYRLEYVYKNAIISKLLLSRHSLSKSSLFEEFKVLNSIADIVIINGTSTVYEIKTEFDDFSRLSNQVESYSKVFDKIFVVISKKHLEKALLELEEFIGIYILTEDFKLSKQREAESLKDSLVPSEMFKLLNKSEYLDVINEEFSLKPDLPNTEIFKYCRNLFSSLTPIKAHTHLVNKLGKRKYNSEFIEFIDKLPESLKAIPFSVKMNKNQREGFIRNLNKTI